MPPRTTNPTAPKQNPPSNFSLKPLWFLSGALFVISLVSSITMIVQTMNWIRIKGTGLPAWFSPMTRLSEWGLALSSLGLLLLAAITVVRGYRDK
jgi:hypothetical protein